MATRKFSELRDKIVSDPLRAERLRQAATTVAQTYESYQVNLRQLRQAKDLTQVQLAKILGISQPEVSRIERQTDVYLSTLQSYVAAMGGELRLVAVFGGESTSSLSVDDVLKDSQESPEQVTLSVITDSEEPSGPADIGEQLALAGIDGEHRVQALRSATIALRQRGMPNFASLMASYTADAIAASGDAAAAGRELGAAGAAARQTRRFRLAEKLWRRSLNIDPTNVRSRSSLGQLLHHQGRYEEALENLETVASMDNHAALFLGWSRLMVGLSRENEELVTLGVNDIISSMHRWAYEANRSQRVTWLRQVKRLDDLGARFRSEVENLLVFASSNSNFGRVTREDLAEVDGFGSGGAGTEDDSQARLLSFLSS